MLFYIIAFLTAVAVGAVCIVWWWKNVRDAVFVYAAYVLLIVVAFGLLCFAKF